MYSMNPILRRIIVLGTPFVLSILLITHPVFSDHAGLLSSILPQLNWWLTIHVLLLPLFCLLALAAYLLTDTIHRTAATVSRVALFIFLIFYPTLDSLVGIGVGTLVRYASTIPSSQQKVIENVIIAFVQNPIGSILAVLGSLGWEIGLLAAAIAISRPNNFRLPITILSIVAILFYLWSLVGGIGTPIWWTIVLIISILFGLVLKPRLPVGLLILASFLFGASHTPPFGPLGIACFFLAALQREFVSWKATSTKLTTQSDETNSIDVLRVYPKTEG